MTIDPPPSGSVLDNVLRQALERIKAGRFAEALDLMTPLQHCVDERIDLLLAHARAGCHDPAGAAVLFCRLAGRYPSALHPAHETIGLLVAQDRRADAEPVLRAVVALTPEDARAHESLGDLLIQLTRFTEAEAALRSALHLRPDSLSASHLLAAALAEQGRIAEADALLRQVLDAHPDCPVTHANRATLLSVENRVEEALDHFRASIALKPDNARVRLNHSIALLKAGRYTQGWAEHEWRFRLPGHANPLPATLMPSITPGMDIAGKRILVSQEEGLGDTLMYLRFLPALVRRGARVTVQVPDALAGLVRRMPGLHRVISDHHAVPAHDWHCPFISLPRVFSATADTMGDAAPYLTAAPDLIRHWAAHIPANGRLNAGLVWGGAPRPDVTNAHIIDQKRSMRLAALAPLARIAGINLVSLQKGPAAEQMSAMPEGMRLYDPMDDVRDMHDTAALIAGLDVVVSVDTSIVHLAGALGCPTILMDRYENCWRWLSGRDDSPWYPSLRIVRQTRPRDWNDVVRRAAAILGDMAEQRPA
ncbi:glycosyltransferase family protein [Gluconacetobacter azotocaptans]|uniref:Glycosyltransferase family protein n=1 Tax=Gluconacetobacter azotocaptans TaxID=142834 RepID=A0A7W4PDW5_9PROT|nr:tetratricopeptide repeat-containing glycosyltransferase family protein [Gluconacetobacter azotocaptans]MBB2190737.1 glycosyltransferase family protein [Gluconacetobacter azotocaptans]GBQ31509.1 O-linked N-acetylglucosamine transferase [Gluconacetobacter azotocaptans DSM 13594]